MYDAIVIPGGGLTSAGRLPPWVEARFERALAIWKGEIFIPLSAGTTYRPLALTASGQPRFEAHAGAEWLLHRDVPEQLILPETLSYDTIGNALFARLLHTDPRGLRRLHVISSEFHLPRCQSIFDWVYSLSAADYTITYESTPNVGISPQGLGARLGKEAAGTERVQFLRTKIRSLTDLHRWIYSEHDAYRASRPAWHSEADGAWLESY